MENEPRFSVVIASIGRSGLTKILKDIGKTSTKAPIEIILVLDGVDCENPSVAVWQKLCSTIIFTPERVGPSVAYTLGLNAVTTEFFRIFTDDDKWDGNSFKQYVRNIPEKSVLVFRTNLHDEIGIAKRSSVFPKKKSPLESVYAPLLPWKRNPVYFHLTSMIFPIAAAKIPFDESLVIREDLYWLQKIYESGISFAFSDETIGEVYPSHARSAERQTIEIDLDWTHRLSLISKTLSRNFVFYHCFRSFAAIGKPNEIYSRLLPLIKVVGVPRLRESLSVITYILIAFLSKERFKLTRS